VTRKFALAVLDVTRLYAKVVSALRALPSSVNVALLVAVL